MMIKAVLYVCAKSAYTYSTPRAKTDKLEEPVGIVEGNAGWIVAGGHDGDVLDQVG